MSDLTPAKTEIASLKNIVLTPQSNVEIVCAREEDGFFFNTSFSDDFRLRHEIYDRLLMARHHLPNGIYFMLYEGYRSRDKQIEIWNDVMAGIKRRHPSLSPQKQYDLCNTFVADPFDGIGSGHQTGAAIDLSLCDKLGVELDMGNPLNEESDLSRTNSTAICIPAQLNRLLLKQALEREGFMNYPAEWWHYSYGDHLWAFYTQKSVALFGLLDL